MLLKLIHHGVRKSENKVSIFLLFRRGKNTHTHTCGELVGNFIVNLFYNFDASHAIAILGHIRHTISRNLIKQKH